MAKDNLERTRNKLGSTQEFYSYYVVISYITYTYTKITEQKYFRFPGKSLGLNAYNNKIYIRMKLLV